MLLSDIGGESMLLKVTSPSFPHDGMIPAKYTCDGDDVSPPLDVVNLPSGTASLAVTLEDPDAPAGTFTHWVAWNLPPNRIAEGTEAGSHGMTSFGRPGYGGPCPPGGTHRYYFTVYALDARFELPERTTKEELLAAVDEHILGKGVLMGKYSKD